MVSSSLHIHIGWDETNINISQWDVKIKWKVTVHTIIYSPDKPETSADFNQIIPWYWNGF
jgi:hypothetical protein